jgi:hypothetical protein
MATTRKRSSGFSTELETENQELPEVTETLEPAEETSEVHSEEPVIEFKPEPAPFVEETIVPLEDLGPRFLETSEVPAPEPKKVTELQPQPKRQPRNVPRFSRTR